MIEELYNHASKFANYKKSCYQIYSLEDKILKKDNGIKKFLIVRFFNRNFNENNDLKELKIIS